MMELDQQPFWCHLCGHTHNVLTSCVQAIQQATRPTTTEGA